MKQDLFIQRLQELAEVKQIKPAVQPGRREADESTEIYRNGEQFAIDKSNNRTWAYQVKRLKLEPKACDDCGNQCKDRIVTKSVYAFPKRHWRTHCSGCNRVWNPDTNQFDLMPTNAQYFFTRRFKQG